MWQQGWTVAPGTSSTQSADDAQKWAAYAQQWMQNKQMLEHWHQQHLQMMATNNTTSQDTTPSASISIDPSVVSNPPPPPPPPSDIQPTTEAMPALQEAKPSSDTILTSNNSSGELSSVVNVATTIPTGSLVPGIMKGSLKSRFAGALSKSATIPTTLDSSSPDTPTKSKPLFAAYEQATDSPDQDGDNGQGKRLPSWLRDELEKMKMKKSKTSGGFSSTVDSSVSSSKTISTNTTDNNSNLNKPLTVKEMFSNDDDDEDQLDGNPVLSNDENSNSSTSRALFKPASEYESSKHHKQSDKSTSKTSSSSKSAKSSELSSNEREELLTRAYKYWTTELLLEVTNQEMQSIAKEVINYEKGLLIKQELKKNSKPLNLAYDEDENNDEDEEDEAALREEDSDFLRKRGEAKRKAYEAKFHLEQDSLVLEEKNSSRSKGSRRSRSRSRGGRTSSRYDEKSSSRRDRSTSRRRSRSRGGRRRDRSRSGSPRGRSGHSRRDHRSRSRDNRRDRHRDRSRSKSKTKSSSKKKKSDKKRSYSRSPSSSSSRSSRSSSSRSRRK